MDSRKFKLNRDYSLICIFLLLSGCTNKTVQPFLSTETLATPIPSATQIVLPPLTATLPATLTPAIKCPQVFDNQSNIRDLKSVGTILVDGPILEPISFLDIQSGLEYGLPIQKLTTDLFLGGEISPDRNMFVSVTGRQTQTGNITNIILWVFNSRGELIKKVSLNQPNLGNLRWLDNEHVVLYSEKTMMDGSVVVVNPFESQISLVSNKLPNFYFDASLKLDWQVEYNSNLNWVVYLGDIEGKGIGPIVYDISSKKIVWSPMYQGNNYTKPIWSNTGSEVAISANGNLYVIEQNGKINEIFGKDLNHQIKWPSWSPDGRFIAFWSDYVLMVYDNQNQTLKNYCIRDDYPNIPIWSPDSKQIVVGAALNKGGTLVDIEIDAAYKLRDISDTVYPVEWMNSIP